MNIYQNKNVNYIDTNYEEEFISSAVNDLIVSREFQIPNSESKKISQNEWVMMMPLVRELAQQAQIKRSEKSSPEKSKASQKSDLNSDYIIPPKIAPQEKVHPFTTTLPLNGLPVSHLTQWEFYTGTNFGDHINTSFSSGGIFKIDGQIIESLTRDNIYTVDQKASYVYC